jgi:hypothetical protein
MNLQDTIHFGCAAYSSIHPHRAAELNHLFCTNGNGYEWDSNGQLVETCGETTFKNGKRRSLKSAINNVFRRRKRDNDFRKKWEAKDKRDRKRHPEKYQTISDSKLDEILNSALKAMKEAKERDPKAFEERQEQLKLEIAESRRQWKESKRWEYKVPTNIKERTEYRTPQPGEWNGYNHWYPMSEGYCKMLTYDPATIADDFLAGIIETCQLIIANPPKPKPSFPHDPDGKYAEKTCAQTVALAQKALAQAEALKQSRCGNLPNLETV